MLLNRDWGFYRVAREIMEFQPIKKYEFGIHLGDYVYLGKKGLKNDLKETANWDDWEADFFAPMQILLEEFPWIMVRGNHETYSSNSGLGYWIFLDQHLKGEALGLKGNGEQGIFGLFTQKPKKNLSLIHG